MRYLTCLILAFAFTNCAPKITSTLFSGIRYVEQSASRDQITVEVIGISREENQVISDGAKKIIEALLYQGVPDSPARDPLIKDRKKAEQHQQFLNGILSENSARFLTDAYLIAPPNKDKKTREYTALVRATVNIRSLKQALRNEGIVPKFGIK